MRREGVFTWDWFYGEEYALASIHTIPASFQRELAFATEALGGIFTRMVSVLRQGEDELLEELGLPEPTRNAVRLSVAEEVPTIIGRFDFARTAEGLKMLELNSDTPTGIVEAFYVNGRVCTAFGMEDPNRGAEDELAAAFQEMVSEYRSKHYPVDHIVFSALGWHEEDAGTTRYLMNRSGLSARFVPLEDLRVKGDRLYAGTGEKSIPVDVWYRLHALEMLAEDEDRDGYPTGVHILDLIARGKLAVINPPGAFIAQTKALQALIWNLHETGQFFTPEEHEMIDTYMLPTYLENRFQGRFPYVVKPVFGREGGAVVLCDSDGSVAAKDGEPAYWDQMMVYQRRVELEQVETETMKGLFRGHRLWGSFLVNGKASAILSRVDGPITGNLSYYLPVGVEG
ncbi:glutathionylspermidine synthase family protein [Paludifilum halophilum]|uniref:Glutathionylspermidine synthase n=1 Tax=Paludifilum halophilum TaxID=1642702 RepID=A0A235B701_9BACL|nr:glutathionylspermidine synthase family protein [Paludifilum halophilum]OYD08080.1 glutathionylspermidine synthase [Paludifilum halophilum]